MDGVHQGEDVVPGEAAAEVAGGGRVGDPLGPESIEVDLVVAARFEMFDAPAAGEEIERDVQDMVGFVVGQMALEQVKIAVDLLDEFDPLSQEEEGPDAAGTEAANAIGMFVVDVSGGHHGSRPFGAGRMVESILDSPPPLLEGSLLACGAFFSESSAHSKAPMSWNSEDVFEPLLFQKHAGFTSYFREIGAAGL